MSKQRAAFGLDFGTIKPDSPTAYEIDVAEATVEFKDNGWGSEALGDYALARMIPNGSRVIAGSGSGRELVASDSNRDEIENYIDDSVVQKYVAGGDVVFII